MKNNIVALIKEYENEQMIAFEEQMDEKLQAIDKEFEK